MKTHPLAYRLQALALSGIFAVLKLLPPRTSSKTGGALASYLYVLFTKQNRKIDAHLRFFLPELPSKPRETIKREIWKNLGMILGEYPHLAKALDNHPDFKIEIKGAENLDAIKSKPTLFVSAHTGNWEMLPLICARLGQPFHPVYRPPNNPYLGDVLNELRGVDERLPAGFTKGRQGLRDISNALKDHKNVGMLVDQRHSGGVKIPFFGRDADTTTAPVDLARKYEASLIPGRIIRNGPCAFTLEILPAISTENRSSVEVMTEPYALFEDWIREHPGQWLWMHRRWGKKL